MPTENIDKWKSIQDVEQSAKSIHVVFCLPKINFIKNENNNKNIREEKNVQRNSHPVHIQMMKIIEAHFRCGLLFKPIQTFLTIKKSGFPFRSVKWMRIRETYQESNSASEIIRMSCIWFPLLRLCINCFFL